MTERRCIFVGCVSTDRHSHCGFPGGYDNPDDPTGAPIPFTSEAAPGVRDYNGALLAPIEGVGRPTVHRRSEGMTTEGRPSESDISEALWEESRFYGVRLTVDEQVTIARLIRGHARRIPTSDAVHRAFRAIGLHAPRGYSVAVRDRLTRLYR
jgi:hypothetical protein